MKPLALAIMMLMSSVVYAQNAKTFASVMKELRAFSKKDSAKVQKSVNKWWDARKKNNQVPLTSPDSAAFFYRGPASSVSWVGDFNFWGGRPAPYAGKRIKNTDIWYYTCAFPSTARLDYKVILSGKDWIVDPVNTQYQYSGVGGGTPNSQISMPGWKRDATQQEKPDVAKGTVTPKKMTSASLGYDVSYLVYTPANSTETATLPILYVTDGNEYSDPRLGNMMTTLNNLIANKSIKPIRVVFIDARDPVNLATNRRMTELSLSEPFLKFLTEELVPAVEGSSLVDRANRGVLGTSLGGLSSTFFAVKRPDLFGLVGINSPAYWYKQEIFSLAEQSVNLKLRTFLSVGTFFDGQPESLRMKAIFEKNGHSCKYIETAEGHSWGQWSNLVDDMLVELFGNTR